ncbi:MAG: Hsp20/alpha crystallin family protein [Methylovulum sp.]|uniref:Hsp20/alpha crystallin family protein n=1 Tax=Methylovulum sp. TaxID=1916980 RepID=UPI0026339534|nr:Hsp20/alpha crystallin family protein [Methylovulum sp.]MDD2725636.1 Hsp20/alpha crystallin family protein [Methylovulum sp.]MDD5125944.1 Hsp20/alpha crystallin family protein [Methylovulum sp.]
MRNLETWMWAEACEILDRADRLHRQFFRPTVMNARRLTWEPPVDVYENSYECKIMIALPGVAPEHLNIILEGGHLIIAGQRHLPDSAQAHIRRLEIPYGRFERRIELPEGHFEMGTREFVNGCLLISLRKL